MAHGGTAALELVARDMRTYGLFSARSLCFKEAGFALLPVPSTPPLLRMWAGVVEAWRRICTAQRLLNRLYAVMCGLPLRYIDAAHLLPGARVGSGKAGAPLPPAARAALNDYRPTRPLFARKLAGKPHKSAVDAALAVQEKALGGKGGKAGGRSSKPPATLCTINRSLAFSAKLRVYRGLLASCKVPALARVIRRELGLGVAPRHQLGCHAPLLQQGHGDGGQGAAVHDGAQELLLPCAGVGVGEVRRGAGGGGLGGPAGE